MLRGEFILGCGLVIPNNITKFGASAILQSALRGSPLSLWAGLVDAIPTEELQLEQLQEPTIGVAGYVRQPILKELSNWPILGETNGEHYLESRPLVWAAVGGNFSLGIRRIMLTLQQSATVGPVVALSGAFPATRIITPTTALIDRTFTYRLYLR